ncbi:MAG: ABC transporter permease [Lachnospiraceae bacterium]|nr:ABC transporter permease [Lachnospiraceae bacterium]
MKQLNVYKRAKINKTQVGLLIAPVVLLSFVLFASFVIDQSLKKGVDNLGKRIGSDFIIVPMGSKKDAENILLEGSRGVFYFDEKIYDEIKNTEGVKETSKQFFLKSMAADCCSSEVEIIFYDPDTDFLIGPWISSEYSKEQDENSVVIGSFVNREDNGKIKIFGREYTVAAQMAKTGTSLDSSIYFTFDSLDTILSDAIEKGSFITDEQREGNLISSVYVNTEDNYSVTEVLNNLKENVHYEYDVIYSKELSAKMASNLGDIYKIVHLASISAALFCSVILFFFNFTIVNSKKTEIALMRIIGLSKREIIGIFLADELFTGIIGSVMGSLIGALFTIPFGDYIGNLFEMPYLGPNILNVVIIILLITLLATGIGIAVSLYPVYVVSTLDPYTALRREGE